tara:strand:- start:3919 stop:4560 length:642 start_codon:yes stop_codon:yes gene_type:complete
LKAENVKVEYTRLEDIVGADDNPKDHDIGEIHESMNRFGFTSPLLMNEGTSKLVAGHGRVEALQQKKQFGEQPPARIAVDTDGEWMVPVIRGITFKSDDEAQAYLIADNRLTEIGGWDTNALLETLEELAKNSTLTGTGFDESDIQRMYDDMEQSLEEGMDDGLQIGKPTYEIVFDDETQQAMWFTFLNWLKNTTDGETIGERLYYHIDNCVD